jgi:hypothetical protein
MIIFDNTSAEIKTKSADVLLKMIIILLNSGSCNCVLKMNELLKAFLVLGNLGKKTTPFV